ncbi:Uncharacterised protein [Acinetobacter baumannii]|nr:Uncharacterised protein [Acinetobacter baumannii]
MQATVVDDLLHVHGQHACQRRGGRLLVQDAALQGQGAAGFKPVAVVERGNGQTGIGCAADDAGVVQHIGVDLQALAPLDAAGGVIVDACVGLQCQQVHRLQRAAVAQTIDRQRGLAGLKGALVVHAAGRQFQRLLGEDASGVVQLLARLDLQQPARRQLGTLQLGDAVGRCTQVGTGTDDALVVDAGRIEFDVGVAVQLAGVVQLRGLHPYALVAQQQAGVVHLAGLHVQHLCAQARALVMRQRVGAHGKPGTCGHLCTVLHLRGSQRDAARALHRVSQGQRATGVQLHLCGLRAAGQVQILVGAYGQRSARRRRTGKRRLPGTDLKISLRVLGTVGLQVTVGFDLQAACGRRASAQADIAGLGQDEVACVGHHLARAAHAHAGLGTDQPDLACIHAPEGGNIQAELRAFAFSGDRLRRQGLGIDLVGAGDHVHLARPKARVELHRAGQQVDAFQVTGIQAVAFQADRSARHPERRQAAIVAEHRGAGGQRATGGIDEAAAIAGDAIGVGDDHRRRAPRHLDVALQARCIGGCHLIEDQSCRLARLQVAVALDVATQLGLHGARAVVEDLPLAPDVVVLEAVVRYAARVGPVDLDDRHAVRRLVGPRLLAGLYLHLGKRAARGQERQCQGGARHRGAQARGPTGARSGQGQTAEYVLHARCFHQPRGELHTQQPDHVATRRRCFQSNQNCQDARNPIT